MFHQINDDTKRYYIIARMHSKSKIRELIKENYSSKYKLTSNAILRNQKAVEGVLHKEK